MVFPSPPMRQPGQPGASPARNGSPTLKMSSRRRAAIEAHRAELAEARAQSQALAREAEIAARRIAAIATDRAGWSERHGGSAAQIATLSARMEEARTERTTLEQMPPLFEEKRRG